MIYKIEVQVKSLELQESLVVDNLQPISENTSTNVSEQVHRLTGEDEVTNKPDTSEGQQLGINKSSFYIEFKENWNDVSNNTLNVDDIVETTDITNETVEL